MKILVISASYPPCHAGGYEIRIKEIMDMLSSRGYDVKILTTRSKKRCGNESKSYSVLRKLHDRSQAKFFPKEILFDLLDSRLIDKTIKRSKPDVIYLGHIYNLSKALLPFLATSGIPLVFDEGGNMLKGAWTDHGRWFRFTGDWKSRLFLINLIKPLLIDIVCKLSSSRIKKVWVWPENMRIIFNSELNRQNAAHFGVPVENAVVIHSGVDTQKFSFKPKEKLTDPLKIIIPGRIEEKKGQLDGLKLMKFLRKSKITAVIDIVGSIGNTSYHAVLLEEIKKAQLHNQVNIFRMIDQEKLVDLYHQADICFFPSFHQVGFSRVPLEAMACGCIVISYGNEGSDEIILDRRNGFIIAPGDFIRIVNLVKEMIRNPIEYTKIISNGLHTINRNFTFDCYVKQITAFLKILE